MRYKSTLCFIVFMIAMSNSTWSKNNSDTTIAFRQVNYSKIFELAQKENKAVLLYFHFDGCGACVKMEKTAFVDKKVAAFYNSNFICLEVNTRKGEGIEINKIYNVQLHPTFLFLDKNEIALNKIVGVFDPAEFILQAKNALDPTKTLAYFNQQYKNGNRESDFLFEYCYKLRDANELDSLVINKYLNSLSTNDFNTEKNIRFIYEFAIHKGQTCISLQNKAYKFMRDNKVIFTPYFDLEQIDTRLMFIVQNEVYIAIERKDSVAFLNAIEMLKEYDVGKEYNFKEIDGRTTFWTTSQTLVLNSEISFYEKTGNSLKYNEALKQYLEKIWDDDQLLNAFAWDNYLKCDDKAKLKKSVDCVKRSIELNSTYENNDTYACLLYKLDEYDKALAQANKAIELAKQKNIDYKETADLIEKIKDKQNK